MATFDLSSFVTGKTSLLDFKPRDLECYKVIKLQELMIEKQRLIISNIFDDLEVCIVQNGQFSYAIGQR